ncbi:MAG: hypothetical protein NC489_42245, partial [Ruminococcus flavefaciens]|nr:hypothetical protein [Ruminococcus flavefaciens]
LDPDARVKTGTTVTAGEGSDAVSSDVFASLSDIIDFGALGTYAGNEVACNASDSSEKIAWVEAAVKTAYQTALGGSTVRLEKKWAVVTPLNGYVNNGTEEKFTPLTAEFTFGDEPSFNTPAPAHGSGEIMFEGYTAEGAILQEITQEGSTEKTAICRGKLDGTTLYEFDTADNDYKESAESFSDFMKRFVTGAGEFKLNLSSFEYEDTTAGITYENAEYAAEFEIKPYDIAESGVADASKKIAVVLSGTDSLKYDGNAQSPTVTVTYEGKELTINTDYTLSFANNVHANLATDPDAPTVSVHGKGNFGGTVGKTFEIKKGNNTFSQLTISEWEYGSFNTDINAIKASATYGVENAVYKVVQLGDDEDIEIEGLEEIKLDEGKYTAEVANKLRTLPAGDYVLRAEIDGTDDYNWCSFEGGLPFTVSVAEVSAPTLSVLEGFNNVYSGAELAANITGFNADVMEVNFNGTRTENGVLYATNAGSYTATVTLKDNVNYKWKDVLGTVTLTWTVRPGVVASPKPNTDSFTVNGSNQTYMPIGFDDRYMTIEDNVRDTAGTTTVTIELKDKDNYVWDTGSTEAIVFGWHINTADTAFAVVVSVLAALIAVGIAVAVMQYISHRQRRTLFEEIGTQYNAEEELAGRKPEENTATDESVEGGQEQ